VSLLRKSNKLTLASEERKRAVPKWWHSPVPPACGRLKQEGSQFKSSLSHIAIFCLKTKQKL
jgi:hypothetical protein